MDNIECKCLDCASTEYERGETVVLTYLFDLGYDLPKDSYSEHLWNIRERLLKEKAFRFKLPLKEIK